MKLSKKMKSPNPSSISRLIKVMECLRDPVNGCPWDIDQTFETIAPYTIEESYEVVDAIERKDMGDLKDELGDLLLQVVYHAQIARELGEFNFEEVARASTDKMVRRHPHVFAKKQFPTTDTHNTVWEDQKELERTKSKKLNARGALTGVAKGLPALLRAQKLQERAARVNFDWATAEAALQKLKEEIEELDAEMSVVDTSRDKQLLLEEIADVLFSAVNVSRKLDINPETALRYGNRKFEKRFKYIEEKLSSLGKEPKNASLEEMEAYWREAKNNK